MIDQQEPIGVLGCGWWGKNIIRTLKEDLNLKIIACFDPSPDARDSIKQDLQVEVTDDIERLLLDDNIKAVCIASPPETHYYLSKQMLNAGKHILIEKPPTFDLKQLDELNSLASKKNLVYMLDCLYLFSDPVVKLKQLLDNGFKRDIKFVHLKRIGDELRRENAGISRIRNTMFNNKVDILDDLFFHDAGILFHLFDSDFHIESVHKLNLYHDTLADTVFVNIKGDIPVKIDLSWTLTPRERRITVLCKDKIVEYDAFSKEDTLDVFWLDSMKNEQIKYQNNQPLCDMLKYFINVINSENRNSYIGNYKLMKKILTLKLSI